MALAAELFPIPRSITGPGARETLEVVRRRIPLDVVEVPSGSPALDWTVPAEWSVREAWLEAPDGTRLADYAENPLQLLGYSVSYDGVVSRDELLEHVFTLEDRPHAVPYRTAYYTERWGFCLAYDVVRDLPDGDYRVHIDTTHHTSGSLSYGELVVPGRSDDEVLVSTHICHPLQANDNVSGIVAATALAQHVLSAPRELTYRFVFVPGTIGSIVWLSRHRDAADRVRAGMVLTALGDPARFVYKQSRRGGRWIDEVVPAALAAAGVEHEVRAFDPYGYDERQYCSPGFDLPVGRLSRSTHAEYPEYHTSLDDLSFIDGASLAASVGVLEGVVDLLEHDRCWRSTSPYGEPQLGRRGLYRQIGATIDAKARELALLWVLSGADGSTPLREVAQRSGLEFAALRDAASLLHEHGLLADPALPPA